MQENTPNQTKRNILRHASWRTFLIILAMPLLFIGGALTWMQHRPSSLLPKDISSQSQNFEVYFYAHSIPAGYSVDQKHATYNQGVIFVPLIKGKDTITLSEQAMPSELSPKALQQNGEVVDRVIGEATINKVEGRLVGTFISPDGKTLALLTTDDDSDSSKSILELLLRDLQHIK